MVADIELPCSAVCNVNARQWLRLNRLLTHGAVVELGWLQSAAGLSRDSAHQVMNALAESGACRTTMLIYHDCAEHNVTEGAFVWPWRCPECEELIDIGDADQVHVDRRLTLTKSVRFK